jgi:arylsulfatase A-like enzyme
MSSTPPFVPDQSAVERSSLLAKLGSLWLVVAGCEPVAAISRAWLLWMALGGGLMVANLHSPVHAHLTIWMRVSFICGEVVLGTVLVVLFASCGYGLVRWGGRLGRVVFGVQCLLVSGFLILSWGQAMLTSNFANAGSIQMIVNDPVAMVRHSLHFHPSATIAMPFLVVGLAALLGWSVVGGWVPSLATPKRGLVSTGVVVASLAAYAVSIPWSLLPFQIKVPFNSPGAGQVSTVGDYMNEMYLRRTGPMVTLLAERAVSRAAGCLKDDRIQVIRAPRMPIEKYLAGGDFSDIERLNVVLIQLEALRPDELAAGGSALKVVPNIDNLAREGVVFNNNYSTATHSNYADIAPLSSQYPLRSRDTHVYPKSPSYPRVLIYDVLKRIGYRTAIISSQNENWGNMLNYLDTPGLDDLLHSDNFDGDTYVPKNDIGFFSMNKKSGKVDDRATIDRAIGWIDRNGAGPFGIFLNLQSSHFPYEVGPGFRRPFGPEAIDFEPRFSSLEPETIAPMRARYRDSLAYADQQIGRLFSALKERGLWEKTIVIVTGDNGEAFMEHGFSGHANRLYDENLKTALVVRQPGRPPAVSNRLVQHVDIPPTILGCLGLPKHPAFQGIDLFNEPESPDREVFLVVQSPFAEEYGIVKAGVKYVFNPFNDSERLFNLAADPGETRNIVAANADVARYLRARLDTWRAVQIEYYENASEHLVWFPPVLLTESQQSLRTAAVDAMPRDPAQTSR